MSKIFCVCLVLMYVAMQSTLCEYDPNTLHDKCVSPRANKRLLCIRSLIGSFAVAAAVPINDTQPNLIKILVKYLTLIGTQGEERRIIIIVTSHIRLESTHTHTHFATSSEVLLALIAAIRSEYIDV